MISRACIIFSLIAGATGAYAASFSVSAMAQETSSRAQPYWTRSWIALDRCAAYGPDFTSVEGTHACVKIGGHVRVEFNSRNFGYPIGPNWGQASAAPAAMRTVTPEGSEAGDFPTAHHLRLRPDASVVPYDGD